MINNADVKEEDLDDYKYLYETFTIKNKIKQLENLEGLEESTDEIDLDSLNIVDMNNYDYIKKLKDMKDINWINSKAKDCEFLLKKRDLEELDNEVLDSKYWSEINEIKKKAVPPKEPLSELEKEDIAENNIALVHYVIKGFYNTPIEYDELFSIGIIGYAKALNSFDKSKNIKFSTYSISCIRNEILYVLRKEKKIAQNTTSLNKVLSTDKNGNSLQLEDTLSEYEMNTKSLEDLILEDENKEALLKALDYLKEEERFILIYRFGLDRGIIKTQKEIADEIGMSQANVSKIQKSCLNKLKLILKKDMRSF